MANVTLIIKKMYACEQAIPDEVSEIDQNLKFQVNSTNELVFLNLNLDITTHIESHKDPVFCPPDQPIPYHIPGIPEKLLSKHRLAGNTIPRPLINNFVVEPSMSDIETICRKLLIEDDKSETTKVEELELELDRKFPVKDIPRIFCKPSVLIT